MQMYQATPSDRDMFNHQEWQHLISSSIVTGDQLAARFKIDPATIDAVIRKYPMRITPHVISLIQKKDDPIWKQVVPDTAEVDDRHGLPYPRSEAAQSPVPRLIHRYPDRVLFMVSNQCAVYCRYCLRKHMVGHASVMTEQSLAAGIAYIRENTSIREVILSGGDPLLLEDAEIEAILEHLRAIPHVEVIRIHTRVPGALPQRITPSLVNLIRKHLPIFMIIQFNHPDEITPEASAACLHLADAGIPLGCQSVLLKGVNNDVSVLRRLMHQLLKIRVRPYYLHHPDPIRGTLHFRVPVTHGMEIMRRLRGHSSGLCVPQYMIDLPDGGGKIPLLPEYIREVRKGSLVVENYEGRLYEYPDSEDGR